MEVTSKRRITVDIRKNNKVAIPSFVQGDTNVVEFEILDNGVAADLSTVGKVVANYKRPDKHVVTREATYTGNIVSYRMGQEEMEVAGLGEVEVQFFNADYSRRVSTFAVRVNVAQSVGEAAELSDELGNTLLQDLLVKGDYAEEQAKQAEAAAKTALTNWLSPVANKAAVDAIAGPKLGDTVQTNDNGFVYRYDGTKWVKTQEYGATALANVNAQLADKASNSSVNVKADRTYVDSKMNDIAINQINKNYGLFDETFFSDSVKQKWTGNTPVNATPPDGGVTTVKLAEKGVTLSKLNDSLQRNIENTNISFEFAKIAVPSPGLMNGATHDSFTRTLNIPAGSTGNGSYLRYFQKIKSADNTKVRIFFKVKTSPGLMNVATLSMDVAIVNNGTTYSGKRDAAATRITLGTDYYLYYIDFTNTYLGEIEIRPFLQINNADNVGAKFVQVERAYYTLTPTSPNAQANDLVLSSLLDNRQYQSKQIYSNQTSYLDVLMDVSEYQHLFIDVSQIYDTSLKIYGYKNGNYTTLPLPLVNLKTGNTFEKATTVGKYQLDVQEYERLKFSNIQSSTNAPVSVTAFWQPSVPVSPVRVMPNQSKGFNEKPSSAKMVGLQPHCMKKGVLYLSHVSNLAQLKKSSDLGQSNTTIYTFAQPIKRATVLDNGNCLVLLSDNTLHLSVDSFTTFNQVMNFGNTPPHVLFGISEYKQYVLMTEYGTVPSGFPGKKVYLSTDYGLTFTSIFNLDEWGLSSGYHTHSAVYDPYEQLIWLCTGDGQANQMIFYSADLGSTWHKASEIGYAPTQATNIMPLRDCVLFGSDARLVGVVRYNRPQTGTRIGSKLDFEPAVVIEEQWGRTGATEVPIASTPFIDYKNSKAYFGFAIIGNSDDGSTSGKLKYGELFATDGYIFKEVYKEATVVGDGVLGVWGDFPSSTKVAARVVDVRENTVIFDTKDIWF